MKKVNSVSRKIQMMAAFAVASLLVSVDSFGQAGQAVSAALTSADTEIRKSFQPVTNIMLVIMAILGVVGAISVYSKWSNGDPDTRKAAAGWFGALIFAGLVLIVIKAVFGVA